MSVVFLVEFPESEGTLREVWKNDLGLESFNKGRALILGKFIVVLLALRIELLEH